MTESFFQNNSTREPSGEIPELQKDTPSGGEQKKGSVESDEARLAAVMSYIPFLCFVPLLNMRDDEQARFHARQGVILFLVELIAFLFLFDRVADFVFTAVLVMAVAFSIAGIYFALQGKNYRLPIIGDLADKSKL